MDLGAPAAAALPANRQVAVRQEQQAVGSGRRGDIVVAGKSEGGSVEGDGADLIDVGAARERRIEEWHGHRVRLGLCRTHSAGEGCRSVEQWVA